MVMRRVEFTLGASTRSIEIKRDLDLFKRAIEAQ
jgi:hypothetical protein